MPGAGESDENGRETGGRGSGEIRAGSQDREGTMAKVTMKGGGTLTLSSTGARVCMHVKGEPQRVCGLVTEEVKVTMPEVDVHVCTYDTSVVFGSKRILFQSAHIQSFSIRGDR